MYGVKSLDSFLSKMTNQNNYDLVCFQHALSTPLTTLLTLTEEVAAQNGIKKRPKYQQAVRTLKELFSSFSLPVIASCEVGSLLQEISELLADDTTRIVLCNVSGQPIVVSNVQIFRLKEALCCLIKNAVEASRGHRAEVLVAYKVANNQLFIHIKDFGKGFTWWQKYIAFLPFVSFKKSGSGMGLYFAYKVIVQEIGGKLSIHSESGSGTSIECVIPRRL